MTAIAGRYQPLEGARPGLPQRARDLQTAQTVLLRVVAVPPDSREAVLARAEAAKGVCHPSLVTLFDVVDLGEGQVLLAHEFVPAQTIAQVAGGQPFHPKRAATLISEIADGVAELHARRIVHGGITQTTMLLTMKGKAKLDRVGDPSVAAFDATPDADLVALGGLLQDLVGRPGGAGGVSGLQAIEVIINRARSGRFASAATLAAMLRRSL